MSVGIVILAAGESARMGVPKQLLAYRGTTLLRHAIDTAHSIPDAPVVVVLGAHSEKIRPALEDSRTLIAENPNWREGMASSLHAGLNTLLAAHPAISAVIFLVCDQPLLSANTLANIIATHEQTGRPIVASEYSGALGVPALFARSIFPELLALSGAQGAQQIIEAYRENAIGIPFPEGAIDLDTPADYAAFGENSLATAHKRSRAQSRAI